MKRPVLIAVAAIAGLAAQPVFATEWLICSSGEASIGLLLGSLDALSISAATVDLGDRHWSTAEIYGKGEPIVVGQGYQDDEQVLVDILDGAFDATVAELRVFKTKGLSETAYAGGVLTIGERAWAVSCEY